MKKLALAIISTFWLLSCSSGPKFDQVAYFKDNDRYRVMVYVAPDATIEQIKEHAQSQMNTPGRLTVVYYYRSEIGLFPNTVTSATSMIDAMEMGLRSGCIAGYWKYPTGAESFIENPYEQQGSIEQ